MITYNKLVRDKIPQIIESSGKRCEAQVLDDVAYEEALKAKLIEELNEVQIAKSDVELIEELADLYEVMSSLIQLKGLNKEQFESVVNEKNEKRGGFKERVFLVEVSE
ncbi:putative house-cleaning noncanonical NTP pyrophosphatase (MazG superfamily) [Paenibacillus anaericanus]|uniref:nucleoside triphosphate pyrophosphohydrolase n=1 Tax=Paenibacillus anaericanus TaxID=170367 RepID=UPI0027805885|nr:nucleoside triphosphate pyrophosphohydrolase [Paenibacillus anaericanus]MDQ0087601.1 putative house-cleaning noncanonical NTP pyrophosphatase (MazG superfamily) [Paenibacillus anaericanus]